MNQGVLGYPEAGRSALIPAGLIVPWVGPFGGGAAAPKGWAFCDGSFVAQSAYPDLYRRIGHAANGGTDPKDGTFKLPDLSGRVVLGEAVSGTGSTRGGTGGAASHTHSIGTHGHSDTLALAAAAGASSGASLGAASATVGVASGSGATPGSSTHSHSTSTHTHTTHDHGGVPGGGVSSGGSGTSGSGNPPYTEWAFIIKTQDLRPFGAAHAQPRGGKDVLIPDGVMLNVVGAEAPDGWVLANGAFYPESKYPELYRQLGHIANGGTDPKDGTFKVPDMRGRHVLGLFTARGTQGGSIDHTHTGTSHSHTDTFSVTSAGVTATLSAATAGPGTTTTVTSLGTGANPGGQNHTHSFGSTHSHTSSHAISGAVSSGSMPTSGVGNAPFQAWPFAIRAGVARRADSSFPRNKRDFIPSGAVMPWAGADTDIPDGYLLCDGSFVPQAAYPELYAAIGHTSNAGNDPGNGTFRLPALQQRIPLGVASAGTGSTRGGTGGGIGHDHSYGTHSHGDTITVGTDSAANVVQSTGTPSATVTIGSGATNVGGAAHSHSFSHTHSHAHTVSGSVGTTGSTVTSGTADPPFSAWPYIIKT